MNCSLAQDAHCTNKAFPWGKVDFTIRSIKGRIVKDG